MEFIYSSRGRGCPRLTRTGGSTRTLTFAAQIINNLDNEIIKNILYHWKENFILQMELLSTYLQIKVFFFFFFFFMRKEIARRIFPFFCFFFFFFFIKKSQGIGVIVRFLFYSQEFVLLHLTVYIGVILNVIHVSLLCSSKNNTAFKITIRNHY
jgi:hypothetical protein